MTAATLARASDGGAVVAIVPLVTTEGGPGRPVCSAPASPQPDRREQPSPEPSSAPPSPCLSSSPASDSHHDGTRLGLPIVRHLVHASGGQITLDAAPGTGLDAHVRLRPAAADRRSGGDGPRAQHPRRLARSVAG